MTTSKPPLMSAQNKLMDYLARRDHSELELRAKLSRHYSRDEVDKAIARAKDERWLCERIELAQRVAVHLHGRHKGHLFIRNYLRKKGLPMVPRDDQLELRKAFAIIETKFRSEQTYSFAEKQKIARTLGRRGFDDETIRRILYEEF